MAEPSDNITPVTTEPDATTTPSVEETTTESFLGEAYRNDPNINKFASPDELAEGYRNLSSKLGADKVVLPREGDNYDTDMQEYMNAIGRPNEAADYSLDTSVLEELGLTDQVDVGEFKNIAHKLNMTDSQAKGAYDWLMADAQKNMASTMESNKETAAQADIQLRQDFGEAYPERMSVANDMFKEHFSDLGERYPGLKNDANFIKTLADLGKNFSESSMGGNYGRGTPSPAEAKAERVALQHTDAYTNTSHPENVATVQKVQGLIRLETSSGQ